MILFAAWQEVQTIDNSVVFVHEQGRNSCRYFSVEFVKLLLMHRYSVDIYSYSCLSGILGSDVKQNTTYAGARSARIVALSISSHEQTPYNRVCCFLIL